MTRNTCVSAFICGSHICKVQPSEFDSIKVGPPSRPSTDTLSRQPSASTIGIEKHLQRLTLVERSEQPVDQGLGGTLIGHRLEQFCQSVTAAELRGDRRITGQYVAQVLALGNGFLAGRLDQMMRVAFAD